MKIIITLILTTLIISCGNVPKTTTPVSTIETIEITSFESNCAETNEITCLKIREAGSSTWSPLKNEIINFEFEAGTICTLQVKKENLKSANTALDENTFTYTLFKIIHKRVNPVQRLHDIWVVKTLNNVPIKNAQLTMDIQINARKIYGNDSCNEFFGDVTHISDTKIIFGTMGSTKKLCKDMTYADAFYHAIKNVRKYRLDGLQLYLLNESNEELLQLLKVD